MLQVLNILLWCIKTGHDFGNYSFPLPSTLNIFFRNRLWLEELNLTVNYMSEWRLNPCNCRQTWWKAKCFKFLTFFKQFVVTKCSKERPGSIVTKTLKNGILIIIATSKESHFNADFKYIWSFIKFNLTHQKLRVWENLPYFRE